MKIVALAAVVLCIVPRLAAAQCERDQHLDEATKAQVLEAVRSTDELRLQQARTTLERVYEAGARCSGRVVYELARTYERAGLRQAAFEKLAELEAIETSPQVVSRGAALKTMLEARVLVTITVPEATANRGVLHVASADHRPRFSIQDNVLTGHLDPDVDYTLSYTVAGYQAHEQGLRVRAGADAELRIDSLEALEPVAPATATPAVLPKAEPAPGEFREPEPVARSPRTPSPQRDSPSQAGPILLGSAALIAAAIGVGFSVDAQTKNAAARDLCPDKLCAQGGQQLQDQALDSADVATAMTVTSLSLAAAASIWLIINLGADDPGEAAFSAALDGSVLRVAF